MKQLFWAAIDGIKKEMSEEEKKASSLSSSSSTPPSVDKAKKSECSNSSNSNSKEEENSGWEDLYDDSEESMINKLSEVKTEHSAFSKYPIPKFFFENLIFSF